MQPLHDDEQNGHLQTIDHVFLNPRNGDPSIAISRGVQQSAQEQMLNTICNLAPQVEEETTEEHDMEPPSQNETEPPSRPNNNPLRTVQIPRNLNPVNEFTSNDHLCYGAFPICFPLGCGLQNPGSIPKADCYHLLNQQSGIIAKDYSVTFILFNESQRHAVVQSLAAKVKASPESFAAFSNIVHDDGFQERCDRAAENPNGPVARNLLHDILPHIRVAGGNVPFGPAERAMSISQLYAMCYRFGLPSFFFTFAPNYMDPLTIRIAIRTINTSSGFPSEDGGFLDFLREWDERGCPENMPGNTVFERTISITAPHLRKIVHAGGIGRAIIYMRMKKAVFKGLFGIDEDNDIKKTVPLSSRPTGIFGQTRAGANATECQGRGDLHGHSLWWTVLTPEVLQFVANKERLAAKLAEVIDSMITSCMNLSDHITSVARKTLNQRPICPIW